MGCNREHFSLITDIRFIIVTVLHANEVLSATSDISLVTPTITQYPLGNYQNNNNILLNGTSVSLTCNIPPHDPGSVMYYWQNRGKNLTVLQSDLIWSDYDGGINPRFSLSSDKSRLTINPLITTDNTEIYFRCRWQNGTTYQVSNFTDDYLLEVGYPPMILNTNPANQNILVAIGQIANFSVTIEANPEIYSPNCSYRYSSITYKSPPDFNFTKKLFYSNDMLYDSISISFTMYSDEFYGKYICWIVNYFGSTTIEFQVIQSVAPITSGCTCKDDGVNIDSFNANHGLVIILAVLLALFVIITIILAITTCHRKHANKIQATPNPTQAINSESQTPISLVPQPPRQRNNGQLNVNQAIVNPIVVHYANNIPLTPIKQNSMNPPSPAPKPILVSVYSNEAQGYANNNNRDLDDSFDDEVDYVNKEEFDYCTVPPEHNYH